VISSAPLEIDDNNRQAIDDQTLQLLLDANVRAGMMACMWCIRCQVNKMLAKAFHRWNLKIICQTSSSSSNTENITDKYENIVPHIAANDQKRHELCKKMVTIALFKCMLFNILYVLSFRSVACTSVAEPRYVRYESQYHIVLNYRMYNDKSSLVQLV
jgi:hypothetical protein